MKQKYKQYINAWGEVFATPYETLLFISCLTLIWYSWWDFVLKNTY